MSEREKFYIEFHYHYIVTGDLEKARPALELWALTYPRDFAPLNNLGAIYYAFGQYDQALAKFRRALSLIPKSALVYTNVVGAYLSLQRLEEAHATAREVQAKNLDSAYLRPELYRLAFLQNDVPGMAEHVAWSVGKPRIEARLLGLEAATAAYSGQLGKSRDFSRQAVASVNRADDKDMAACYEASAALREALFGNVAETRQRVVSAVGLSADENVQYGVSLALALVGDAVRAQSVADDLRKRYPEDTIVRFNYLPTLHAQLALIRNDAPRAIEVLRAAGPYELGYPGPGDAIFSPALYPVYVRGEAYLAAHQGSEGAVEFKKILDHSGIVVNEPIGALAHLGLARAYVLLGDTAKARAAYQDFLSLWKDADPDIPILKEAKAEYAKLQ